MPTNRPFIDSFAQVGRARLAPDSALTVNAKSASRSLNSLRLSGKLIKCEIRKDNYLLLDTSSIIGDKVLVTKTNAVKLADWILETYGRKIPKTGEAKLARKSKGSK